MYIVQVTGLMPGPVIVDSNMLKQTVTWTPPNITDMSVITGYTLRYRTDGGQRHAIEADKDKTSAEIALDKPTGRITYYVTVSAISSEGEGPPSKHLNITYKRKCKCSACIMSSCALRKCYIFCIY